MTQATVDTEAIKAAVQLACRAPSLHNSQPWRWVAHGASVDLFADPHRIVEFTDGSGRQSLVTAGFYSYPPFDRMDRISLWRPATAR